MSTERTNTGGGEDPTSLPGGGATGLNANTPGRGTPGGSNPAVSAAGSSPGADPGSGMGGDMEVGNDANIPPDPAVGMAGRAAAGPGAEDGDDPAGVPGVTDTPTTPGHTP